MIEQNTNAVVTINDIASIAYCRRGARKFFADRGLDWSEFLKNGIPISTLETFDDVMVQDAIAVAKARIEAAKNE